MAKLMDNAKDVEKEQEPKKRICAVIGCTQETHGPDYRYCVDHLPPSDSPVQRIFNEKLRGNNG